MDKLLRVIKRDGFGYTAKRVYAFLVARLPLQLSFQYYKNTRLIFAPTLLTYGIFANRSARSHDINIITENLTEGSVMIDAGANIGSVSIAAAAHVGASGKVLTFEPSPKFHKIIQKNVQLNNFADRVTVHQVALGATARTVYLDETVADDTTNVISNTGTKVQQHTLDQYTRDFDCIDMLKIDVEGYEQEVLLGASATLKKTKRVYIEFIPSQIERCGGSPQEVLHILQEHFSIYTVADGTAATFSYNPHSTNHPDLLCIKIDT